MLSYARGPSLPLLDKTIGQILEDAAAHNPSGDALISRHQGICGFLTANCRIRWNAPPAAFGVSAFAPAIASACGHPTAPSGSICKSRRRASALVLVNVNPAYRSHELRFVLQKSGMKAIFLHETRRARQLPGDPRTKRAAGRTCRSLTPSCSATDAWTNMLARGVDPAAARAQPR